VNSFLDSKYNIAEFCGWTNLHYGDSYDIEHILYGEPPDWYWETQESCIRHIHKGKASVRVPDYDRDLNAIHLAEKCLSEDTPPATKEKPNPQSQLDEYRINLCIVTFMEGGPVIADAPHRLKAFLKTIGKYYEVT
jgi:hypothetical protein